jgi:cell division protein FtsQ
MDGRGRLAQPLNRTGHAPERTGSTVATSPKRRPARRVSSRGGRATARPIWIGKLERSVARNFQFVSRLRLNRGGGVVASTLIVVAAIGYGVIAGGHLDPVAEALRDLRDGIGRTVGFRIASIAFAGNKHLNREEILARAGVTGLSSLLFFDVTAARARLMSDPRIADAAILKLFPDQLQISIVERQPFALWQINRRVSVIAEDGTVLTPYVSREYLNLPMFVGRGAESRAKELLQVIDRYPDIRANLRASILVAERRWNLRLTNGLDIKLPEADIARALDQLTVLDRDNKLTTRDIVAIDLRQLDRVTVQLSDAAAQARDAAIKEKAKLKKGGNA